MDIKFCFDQYPIPNLAKHRAVQGTRSWREFSVNWPYSEPPMLLTYLEEENLPFEICKWTQCGKEAFYIIALSYFDFSISWPDLLPDTIKEKLRARSQHILFFYSEGDNPYRIRQHLDQQFLQKNLPTDLITVVTANSQCDNIPNMAWFCDDEMLYRHRNKTVQPEKYHELPRQKMFTALCRTHKWWRATTMAEIWRRGWHDMAYFSYNKDVSVDDREEDNPIQIDDFKDLRSSTYDFLNSCPFKADQLTHQLHNDHRHHVSEHYTNSYLNVVLETHMDTDQSQGVFLTEKTFKPIKHAQPFVIFGAPHTLAKLRDLGYKTFDQYIDNSYDSIVDTTKRWQAIFDSLEQLLQSNMHEFYINCRDDILHNQQVFLDSKQMRLNTLVDKICKK